MSFVSNLDFNVLVFIALGIGVVVLGYILEKYIK